MLYFSVENEKPAQPLVVEDCWPTKKTRNGGCRKRTSVHISFSCVETVQTEPVLDAEVETEHVLDATVQTEPVLDAMVQTEPVLEAEVQPVPVRRRSVVGTPNMEDAKRSKSMIELLSIE